MLLQGQVIPDPLSYLRAYRECWYCAIGAEYLDAGGGNPNELTTADVATSLLMNSQATAFTVRTIASHGVALSELLHKLPLDLKLQDEAAPSYFEVIADLIAAMTSAGRIRTPSSRKDCLLASACR